MKKWLWALGLSVFLGMGVILAASRGPDFRIEFDREVHSRISADSIRKSLFRIQHWPSWHHQATGARLEPPSSSPGDLAPGSRIVLQIDPRGQTWRRFELRIRVLEADPAAGKLRLRLEQDSKGRISALLKDLEWTIEVAPDGKGSLIRGHLQGDTLTPRARFFGRLASRTLMNQLFYPDLHKLGGFESAEGLELAPR